MVTRALKVGLFLPVEEYGVHGNTPRWRDLAAFTRRAEELGFDSVWLADHMIFGKPTAPPPERRGAWEAFSLMSALAAVTNRIEIGTLVACTQFRNPALLAKMADTMDEISNGRIVLGIGAGWNEPEFKAFGYPFDHRVARFEEALNIIHPLLKTGRTSFSGDYYTVEDCDLRPRGPRPGGPPIMIGSVGERMLDLTARYADRWNAEWWSLDNGNIRAMQERVDAACNAVGRDPSTLHRSLFIALDMGTGSHFEGSGAISGTPAQLATFLNQVQQEGIDEVQAWLDTNTVAGLEAFAPVLGMLTAVG